MLYYWRTKYTTLIYRPFFIFPRNRHFFVHISPSILGVWKFPFCKIPFQPSKDTDALLSELPLLSHNIVRTADPSQIRKDGSRRVPDQGYRRGVEELPIPSLQLLPMWGKQHGGERFHAGWWCFVPDVYRAMHDGACAVSGHNEQQWWFAQVPEIWPKSTPVHPRRLPITFAADGTVFAVLFDGKCKCCHSILCHFVSGSKWWNQLSLPVTVRSKKSLPSCRYLCSSSEVMAFRWPLWSSVNKCGTQWAQTFL